MKLMKDKHKGVQGQVFLSQVVKTNFSYKEPTFAPPVYTVQSGTPVPIYNQPVQLTHYTPAPGMFSIKTQSNSSVQLINQPSSYQVNNIQPHDRFGGNQGGTNYYAINTNIDTNNSNL